MKSMVEAACIYGAKGVQKHEAPQIVPHQGHGTDGDAHAGPWHRQVSLLAGEGRIP